MWIHPCFNWTSSANFLPEGPFGDQLTKDDGGGGMSGPVRPEREFVQPGEDVIGVNVSKNKLNIWTKEIRYVGLVKAFICCTCVINAGLVSHRSTS